MIEDAETFIPFSSTADNASGARGNGGLSCEVIQSSASSPVKSCWDTFNLMCDPAFLKSTAEAAFLLWQVESSVLWSSSPKSVFSVTALLPDAFKLVAV